MGEYLHGDEDSEVNDDVDENREDVSPNYFAGLERFREAPQRDWSAWIAFVYTRVEKLDSFLD